MLLGGFGFLSRLHGLSIDNLVEVEMVLADGRIVIVNEHEHPGERAPPNTSLTLDFDVMCYCRSMVGAQRRWYNPRNCHTVQGQSIPSACRLRWKPNLVSEPNLLAFISLHSYGLISTAALIKRPPLL